MWRVFGLVGGLLLVGCIGTPDHNSPILLDDSWSVDEREIWHDAAARLESATGVKVVVHWGKCGDDMWCASQTSNIVCDNEHRDGCTNYGGEIEIERHMSDKSKAETVLHEMIHSRGMADHVHTPTIMHEDSGPCISDVELAVFCEIQSCTRRLPECDTRGEWY